MSRIFWVLILLGDVIQAREPDFIRMPDHLSDGRVLVESIAIDVNAYRHAVGLCSIRVDDTEVWTSFFWNGTKGTVVIIPIPIAPKEESPFTHIEVVGLGDTDFVACNAQRSVRSGKAYQPGRVPYVWDAILKVFVRLPIPLDMNAAAAEDISADGSTVVGTSHGSNGARAVVWKKENKGWRSTLLPGEHAYVSGMSPNGDFVVGKAPEEGPGSPFYAPVRWEYHGGKWSIEYLGPGPGIATAVTNDGRSVGWTGQTVRIAFVVDGKGVIPIGVLPDHTLSEAFGIANGYVVGYSQEKDFPDGTSGRMRAFVWDAKEGMRRLFPSDTTDARSIHPSGIVCGAYAEDRKDPEEERDRAYIYSPPFLKP